MGNRAYRSVQSTADGGDTWRVDAEIRIGDLVRSRDSIIDGVARGPLMKIVRLCGSSDYVAIVNVRTGAESLRKWSSLVLVLSEEAGPLASSVMEEQERQRAR